MKQLSIVIPDAQTNMSTIACIIGSYQVIMAANAYYEQQGQQPVYKVNLVSANKEKQLSYGFLSITSISTIADCSKNDLIIVPATSIRTYETATTNNKLLIDWLKSQYKEGAEVASMCVGSFMLAATGLLSGKTCSTHWAKAEEFKTLYPEVNLQTDKLITDENGIYTNGGAYSFLHLLIYLVGKFYDRKTAIHCAKYFQIDLDRHLQSEFSIFNGHKKHDDSGVLEAQNYLEEQFHEKISIEELANHLGIGRRNFDRRFIKATGLTPLDYLQRVRMEAAKKSFETSRKSVNEVMYDVGYNDPKAFRDVFNRVTGTTPIAYKEKYNIGIN